MMTSVTSYRAPIRDFQWVLESICDLETLSKIEEFSHADPETSIGALEELGRLMSEVWAPTNVIGDTQHLVLEDGVVTHPDGLPQAYEKLVEAGWHGLPFPAEYGGGSFPLTVATCMSEMMISANLGLAMCPGLTWGAVDAILAHGSEEQKEVYLPKMVSGEWGGTMNLTEPQAGSDVGALTTKATPADDGSWRIKGTKIYISFGEHEMTENIIHLVLARTPGGKPGTKGISLFIVPKFLVNEDGSLGERNEVTCVSIEHKMGIHCSPTCVLAYGDDQGAVGYLLGEEFQGMEAMFTMMNAARILVGLQGVGVAEMACQAALEYAQERRQGHAIGTERDPAGSPIIEHPDVRRNLMTMRALTEATRGVAFLNSEAFDLAHHHPDPDIRATANERCDILTPITKSWGTDAAVEVTSLGVQVHGGMGYIEEAGVAQYFRDARIAPIYEGTNGIQAMDLVGRKLAIRMGGAIEDLYGEIDATIAGLDGLGGTMADASAELTAQLAELRTSTTWVMEHGIADPIDALSGATPFLNQMAYVVGGWVMARSAIAAHTQLAGGEDDFLEARVTVARFYLEQILPRAGGLAHSVRAGKGDLFALTAGQMGSS